MTVIGNVSREQRIAVGKTSVFYTTRSSSDTSGTTASMHIHSLASFLLRITQRLTHAGAWLKDSKGKLHLALQDDDNGPSACVARRALSPTLSAAAPPSFVASVAPGPSNLHLARPGVTLSEPSAALGAPDAARGNPFNEPLSDLAPPLQAARTLSCSPPLVPPSYSTTNHQLPPSSPIGQPMLTTPRVAVHSQHRQGAAATTPADGDQDCWSDLSDLSDNEVNTL